MSIEGEEFRHLTHYFWKEIKHLSYTVIGYNQIISHFQLDLITCFEESLSLVEKLLNNSDLTETEAANLKQLKVNISAHRYILHQYELLKETAFNRFDLMEKRLCESFIPFNSSICFQAQIICKVIKINNFVPPDFVAKLE